MGKTESDKPVVTAEEMKEAFSKANIHDDEKMVPQEDYENCEGCWSTGCRDGCKEGCLSACKSNDKQS